MHGVRLIFNLSHFRMRCNSCLHAFFYKQHFYKQRQAKKNQANAKQHPEAELLLFENCLLSSSKLSSKKLVDILKNVQKPSTSV